MEAMPDQIPKSRTFARTVVRKITTLAFVTIVFGWLYSWASPRAFPQDHAAGFGYGILNGALMPLSLPSLLIGRDVQIYHPVNTGRTYKIGYICGVNICGLAFLGPLFWRPRVKSANSGKSE